MNGSPTCVALGLFILSLFVVSCVSEMEREATSTSEATRFTLAQSPVASATPGPLLLPTRPPIILHTIPPPRPSGTPETSVEPVPELMLDVHAPANGITVGADAVVVHGVTSPGALVRIGDIAVDVGSDGSFQAEVSLAPGINAIQIVATDSLDNRESIELAVTSLALLPQPFLLLVTEPEDQTIVSESVVRLSGRTGPEAIASVNGVSISVDELGFFSTTVTLEPGPNIIDVVATDTDGRVLSTVIAVIYRP